ncbi:hypothetical protein AWZ03_006241 [Drosophila navojoa]|uniref:Uncharacterized protein n=1 Tax=Drosophila navojoa TaxID=7232 RepID=A0A484BGJ7_DRONA|nr:hypothetical protein AWZ03_006241 [Drosophila navojoa]
MAATLTTTTTTMMTLTLTTTKICANGPTLMLLRHEQHVSDGDKWSSSGNDNNNYVGYQHIITSNSIPIHIRIRIRFRIRISSCSSWRSNTAA